ncbi:3-carboxy-cis,cis-muconate cycloisomerase [Luedemannella helvata]|uniref:3-carboxy-cis,cis-muconate cycloisomerase n=1 Tax=Luedemannella helvata TaxID=349315 RepID=A0ABN2KIH0_9ACTN
MFEETFGSPAAVAATSDAAWVRAMLDAEAALAHACAARGLIPGAAAEAIGAACATDLVDPTELSRAAVASATPVIPLVAAIRAAVPEYAEHVHVGATSQDIVDTAMMLVTQRTRPIIEDDLRGCVDRLGDLLRQHGTAGQLGRTLLQPAEPMTFADTAGGWLDALEYARAGLSRPRPVVQLGGAVGTTAAFGPHGRRVGLVMAERLGLAYAQPWQTDRARVAELGAALGVVAGALGKVALDVILLSQAEVGEVSEFSADGGRSSAMPHKRNPARAVLTAAAAHRAPALVSTLFAGMPQELQRAAGRWQAEWPTLTDLLRVTAGAAHHARAMLDNLRVRPDRMAANLSAARS